MKNSITKLLSIILLFTLIVSCNTKIKPASERVKKIWTAKVVVENTTTVFTAGATSNVKPGYSTYSLDLSAPPKVTLRDIDGGSYTGTYDVSVANKLSLKGLTPQPTGTGGNLDFNMTIVSDTELKLVTTTAYPKTGNTNNTYTLISN